MTARIETLYGIHPVLETLRAGRRRVHALAVAAGRRSGRIDTLMADAAERNIPVAEVPSERLAAMAGSGMHQGVCARVGPFPYRRFEDLLAGAAARETPPFWLLLDSIQDPHNLGALIRSAVGVGIDAILVPRRRSASATPTVSRISAGALEHSRLAQVTNLTQAMAAMQQSGIWIAGLDGSAQRHLYETDLTGPMALVVGGEESGIRRLVKRQCDLVLAIPQIGPIGSLNASVAGAVAMYEVFRQRQTAGR